MAPSSSDAKPEGLASPQAPPSRYPMPALIVGAVLSSVLLIVVNKVVFEQFPFVFALSTLHFLTAYVMMFVLSSAPVKLFERKSMPLRSNLLVGGIGVGAICLSNYSLRFNSVGVYQMAKLCVIPTVLLNNLVLRGEMTTRKVLSTLTLVLLGVGFATVTDLSVNTKGSLFAFASVLCIAQFQIWQGSKQREHGLSELQVTMTVAGSQLCIGSVFTAIIEGPALYARYFGDNVDLGNVDREKMILLGQILASCLLAVSVQWHSFALIGRTSAVTWQVVGHAKTSMIILAGYLFFPLPPAITALDLAYNLSAVCLAILGVILYSNVKVSEGAKTKDWCDLYAPAFFLKFLMSGASSDSSASAGYAQVPSSANLGDDEPLPDLEEVEAKKDQLKA